MFDSITSTQIITLAIAPLLLISAIMLCELAMLVNVHILLTPHEEEVHSSS